MMSYPSNPSQATILMVRGLAMNSPFEPSQAEIEIAYAILGRLLNAGADPRLLADGRITLGGPATAHESRWCREHREAFRSALVGAGRYERGTLDRIYGIGRDADHAL
jgi:hypothetical protein